MKEIKGDLIALFQAGQFDLLIHGCNCFCTWGRGFALQLKKAYPLAYQTDSQTIKGDPKKLGTFTVTHIQFPNDPKWRYIINLYSQYDYRGTGVRVDYEALRRGFNSIKSQFSGYQMAYPALGAGLGGGDWTLISQIIDQTLEGEDHTLVTLPP